MSEIGDDMMNNDKWIICYYSKYTHRLITLAYDYLESALEMLDKIIDIYDDDVEYHMFKGKECYNE